MKKISLIVLLFICQYSYCQNATISQGTQFVENEMERVFLHSNSTFLLSGEYLYYKFYSLNDKGNSRSNLSKIGYVELIGEAGEVVFKHKISLKTGLGQGEFIIPRTIPSGNYKLIAYTQWMRNIENHFFQTDISILNPFLKDQSVFIQKKEPQDSLKIVSRDTLNQVIIPRLNIIKRSQWVNLSLSKRQFNKRDKVELTVAGLKDQLSYGDYSISIRKLDAINSAKKPSTEEFRKLTRKDIFSRSNITYLPELRGELLSGRILRKSDNQPIANAHVALSIPGEESLFKIASTGKYGVFHFNILHKYANLSAIIQIIDNKEDMYKIQMQSLPSINYRNLDYFKFKIDTTMKSSILKRHLLNQVENAYYSVKQDSFKALNDITAMHQGVSTIYYLDDFVRFKTMKETVIEVINEVIYKPGKHTFNVRTNKQMFAEDLLPLILIDGIMINDHSKVFDLNVKGVEKISVVPHKYMQNGVVFEGVIAIETFKKDYVEKITPKEGEKLELFRPLQAKNYFNQVYATSTSTDRIPDFRSQLLWEPNLKLDANITNLTFYTSDNIGDYEICLEGFTNDGKPISIREFFTVE